MSAILPAGQSQKQKLMTPEAMLRIARDHGCTRLLAKQLSPNDNSKNQIYLGGDFSALNLLPLGELKPDSSDRGGSRRERLKAEIQLAWFTAAGAIEPAPTANLILYPKYPEVRLSGMLKGVRSPAPSEVIANRKEGRWLFLGVGSGTQIFAYPALPQDPCAQWATQVSVAAEKKGVFVDLTPYLSEGRVNIKTRLFEISRKGWIVSKRLDPKGAIVPCHSENCGGYTLEAELGITPNGRAEPDFDGWEVKQFNVKNLDHPTGGPITLFTPEPDGGLYKERGVEDFLRQYGRPSTRGIPGRLDFAGIHRVGAIHESTGLRLSLMGWDQNQSRIQDLNGGIHLTDGDGVSVATWSFRSLMEHWKRKHAQAVYVPSEKRDLPLSYRFGSKVLAGIGADFGRVLASMSTGNVYYDPGIKLEQDGSRIRTKRRNQFRIKFGELVQLYSKAEWWELGS